MFGKPAFALSCHSLSVRERGRVIPPNQHINHNRQQIKHRHPRKHRLIPKRGNQSPCNRAANADADIIRAEEGGVCTAALFGWCNRHRHGLQCRLQSAEAKAESTAANRYVTVSETAPKQKRHKPSQYYSYRQKSPRHGGPSPFPPSYA